MRDDTKLAAIRTAMSEEDWDKALALAARFQRLGKFAVDIRRASDALKKPDNYRQLGFDVDELRAKGIAALKERYSKSWEQSRTTRGRRRTK